MISVISKNGCYIRLTDERIGHIFGNHPEMEDTIALILETLEEPEVVYKGDYGELIAIKKYGKTPVSRDKYLAVVYKETDAFTGFIITAYFTSKLNKSREVLWTR